MRIITGDECGILKESIPELSRSGGDGKDAQPSSVSTGIFRLEQGAETKMNRSRGVVDLCFSQKQSSSHDEGSDAGSLSFCALRADGSLDQFAGFAPYQTKEDRICGGTYNMTSTIKNVFEREEYAGRPIAMCSAHQYQSFSADAPSSNIITCCSSMGLISVVDTNNIEKGVVAQYNAYSKGKGNTSAKITYTGGNFINRDIATAMAMSDDGQKVIVGGRERAATMMDIGTGKTIWKAKNLPPNPQTLLQQPIWSSAIEFLSKTDTASIGGSTDLLAIGTAYKQLQIYDIRADATQRRPVIYTPEWDSTKENLLDHRVTSLCQLDSKSIIVGDSAGFMHTLDLRKIKNQHGRSTQASVGRFTGPAGSVRQIMKHESLPIVACVGLDRMLRTYDIHSRKQLDCVYLKQRLNCMLFCSDGTWGDQTENENEEMDDDGDIDAEDEIADYVNSSDEEASTDDEEDAEDSIDGSEQSDSDEESPMQKKRKL